MSNKLTDKSRTILRLISEGHSYSQIVDGTAKVTYLDIFQAASEALHFDDLEETTSTSPNRMADAKAIFPNAYAKWKNEDDQRLRTLFQQGDSIDQIAEAFRRQPSAIRSRLQKLGLST